MGITNFLSVFRSCFFLIMIKSCLGKTPDWPGPYWDIPGSYCSLNYPNSKCCKDRNDECSVPILGTLCYCDQFCNRTESDCCPDYFTHCKGVKNWNPIYSHGSKPEEIKRPEYCPYGFVDARKPLCHVDDMVFNTREKIKINCNNCKCQVSEQEPGCMELLCDRNKCLLEEEVLKELKAGGEELYSWTPSNYSFLWGRTLQEGVNDKLGALRPDYPVNKPNQVKHMAAVEFRYDPFDLPRTFDSRKEWPSLITGIQDQGWCSSSWAISTVSVASDRLSISLSRRLSHRLSQSSESTQKIMLSPQSLISCDDKGQAGCNGGHIDQAWNFLRKYGAIPVECFPYTSATGEIANCPVRKHRKINIASLNCTDLDGRKGLFKTQPAYRVGRPNIKTQPKRREQDIMFEISKQGPVQALMEVPTDLFMYGNGVYSRTNLASLDVAGYHAVKILGWGETVHKEEPLPYWIVANSWGSSWGEAGYFKIKRGSNECMIEEFVIAAWARQERSRRVRRRHPKGDSGRFFSERSRPSGKLGHGRHTKNYQVG